jgi:RNA polymerase sigma factor (sigma-70 family)
LTPASSKFGSHQTIDSLYRAMGKAALAKTYRLVRKREVAEEIVQEVFLRLWQSSAEFPHDKAIYMWIYRSCHNAAIDHLRSAAARYEGAADPLEMVMATHDDQNESRLHNRRVLEKMLGDLSKEDAELLAYRHVDGMTQEEIAELIGVSRKTVVRWFAKLDSKLSNVKEMTYEPV